MGPPHVQVVIASTRVRRRGGIVGRWVAGVVGARADCTSELLDLRTWDLPFFVAARPPARGGPQDDRAREWGETVARGDAYVIVTPEYNHGYPAALKNALDHVYDPWVRKPVAFVGYGGSGGGVRAVEQLRLVAAELQMASVRQQVVIPRAFRAFDEAGRPLDGDFERVLGEALDDLLWWARALAVARAG
jgi:NAD(P)H-dependent FMN reductase